MEVFRILFHKPNTEPVIAKNPAKALNTKLVRTVGVKVSLDWIEIAVFTVEIKTMTTAIANIINKIVPLRLKLVLNMVIHNMICSLLLSNKRPQS